jgi:GNAT superfamily N-acetyltransferase
MSDVTVRRATPQDAADVLTMVREIAAHQGDVSAVAGSVECWAAMLARPEVIVLVAERQGRPVGYVSALRRLHLWMGTDILSLDDLFVRDGHRDAGIGRLLMDAMAELAAPEQMVIRWELDAANTAAERFYRRLGATVRDKKIAFWRPAA